MSVIGSPFEKTSSAPAGVRLYRFSVEEYERMARAGIFHEDDPIELIDGLLSIKSDVIPPYGVPVGIPPDILWEDHSLYGRHPIRRVTAFEYAAIMRENVLDPAKRHEMVEGWVIEKMTHNARHDYVLSSAHELLAKTIPADYIVRIQCGLRLDESTPEPDLAIVRGPRTRYRQSHPVPTDAALVIEVSDTTYHYDSGMKARMYARNGVERYWVIDTLGDRLELFEEPSGPVDEPSFAVHQTLEKSQRVPLVVRGKLVAELEISRLLGDE